MASDAMKGVLLGWIVPLGALTVAAAAGGGLIGTQIVASVKAVAGGDKPAAASAAGGIRIADAAIKELTPIVTNLA